MKYKNERMNKECAKLGSERRNKVIVHHRQELVMDDYLLLSGSEREKRGNRACRDQNDKR